MTLQRWLNKKIIIVKTQGGKLIWAWFPSWNHSNNSLRLWVGLLLTFFLKSWCETELFLWCLYLSGEQWNLAAVCCFGWVFGGESAIHWSLSFPLSHQTRAAVLPARAFIAFRSFPILCDKQDTSCSASLIGAGAHVVLAKAGITVSWLQLCTSPLSEWRQHSVFPKNMSVSVKQDTVSFAICKSLQTI